MPRKGTADQRGYDAAHRRRRRDWRPRVEAGLVDCWRCGERILPGTPWVLGHVDYSNRRLYRGPEHKLCSDRSGQEVRAAADPKPRPRTRW